MFAMEILVVRLPRWLFCVILSLPAITMAGWITPSGMSLPDTSFRKADAGFSGWLIFVADDQELYNAWQVKGESLNIAEIETVSVNSPISAFVVFSGCKPDDAGMCDVTMRFRVIAPDGTTYAETPAMEVWRGRPAPPTSSLELSVDYLKVVIEPHEQIGPYSVQLQLKDANAGKVISLERTFRAVPAS